jgi:hypothetical protein
LQLSRPSSEKHYGFPQKSPQKLFFPQASVKLKRRPRAAFETALDEFHIYPRLGCAGEHCLATRPCKFGSMNRIFTVWLSHSGAARKTRRAWTEAGRPMAAAAATFSQLSKTVARG